MAALLLSTNGDAKDGPVPNPQVENCHLSLKELVAATDFHRPVKTDAELQALTPFDIPGAAALKVEQRPVLAETLEWAKGELAALYRKDGKLLGALETIRQKTIKRLIAGKIDASVALVLAKELVGALGARVDPRFPLLPAKIFVPEHERFFLTKVLPILQELKLKADQVDTAIAQLEGRRALAERFSPSPVTTGQIKSLNEKIQILKAHKGGDQIREDNVYKQIPTALARNFPYGMRDRAEYESFGKSLRRKLAPMLAKIDPGTPAAKVYVGGSAASGRSFERKVPELDLKRPFNEQSDYDVAVVVSDAKYADLVARGIIASDSGAAKEIRSVPYSSDRSPEKLAALLGIDPKNLTGLKVFTHGGEQITIPIEKVSISVYGESFFNRRNTPGNPGYREMLPIP